MSHETSAHQTPQNPPAEPTLSPLAQVPRMEAKEPFLEVEQVGRYRWKSRVAWEVRWIRDAHERNPDPYVGPWGVDHYGPKDTRIPTSGVMIVDGRPYWFYAWSSSRALRKARKWLERHRKAQRRRETRERVEP